MSWLPFIIGVWFGINLTVFALGVWIAEREKATIAKGRGNG